MADTIVIVRGTVTTAKMFQDPEGKKRPYIRIEILQIAEGGSNITTIKDMKLDAKYIPGQNLEVNCVGRPWSMDNGKRFGVSYSVFRGEMEDIKLETRANDALGNLIDGSQKKKVAV